MWPVACCRSERPRRFRSDRWPMWSSLGSACSAASSHPAGLGRLLLAYRCTLKGRDALCNVNEIQSQFQQTQITFDVGVRESLLEYMALVGIAVDFFQQRQNLLLVVARPVCLCRRYIRIRRRHFELIDKSGRTYIHTRAHRTHSCSQLNTPCTCCKYCAAAIFYAFDMFEKVRLIGVLPALSANLISPDGDNLFGGW